MIELMPLIRELLNENLLFVIAMAYACFVIVLSMGYFLGLSERD